MGHLNLESGTNSFYGEFSDCPVKDTKGALACMVNSEIGAVLAVMRRNVRWRIRYVADDDQLEHSLIHSLKELRKQIFSWQHKWHNIDPAIYLQPFLDVIQSDETGAPITGVALSSVYKILTLDVLDVYTVNVAEAMHLIVDAVTTCRFEVIDPASEEVVLMKILQVLLACMKSKVSVKLSNQHVCNIVNTCFRVVHQASLKGELLQMIAHHTMHELVRCIFSHLPDMDKNEDTLANGSSIVGREPFGVPCMVEIFHFLCSLLNVIGHIEVGSRSNPIAYDEDVPLFALGLINSAIELGGPSFSQHPALLSLIQGELFRNLMQFGLSMIPLILSTVCSIVLNLYHHLRTELKLQFEAFFSCEVAMEALVDLCRQQTFIAEMYANFDLNGPLSAMHIVALDGLVSMIKGMADRIGNELSLSKDASVDLEGCKASWTTKCETYSDPNVWIPHVLEMRHIKRKLMVGVDHFNRDPKTGLQFLQGMHLLPEKLDPLCVASLFRYTAGLDKNLIGDFLGNHDEFCVQVLQEFARTFDFQGLNLDTALQNTEVLEAFAERYYEQSPLILANKDAALLLSYSLILLNTDQHNVHVKEKMTEEDFIRNNRCTNGGKDFPREYLSELYCSICENEIQMIPEQGAGFPLMTTGCWINVLHNSKITDPFIICDSRALLDYDMLIILSGPTIAAMSAVFYHAEHEEIAKISSSYNYDDVLDDLVVSLCKFTSHLTPLSVDDAILAFGEDTKARMAATTVFTMANRYGDYIRCGWKNILNCVLSFHKLGLLPARLVSDAADDMELSSDIERAKPAPSPSSSLTSHTSPSGTTTRKSSGLMGRFSQLLSFDIEEPRLLPTEEQLAEHQLIRETIQSCYIDSIFTESKFLQSESLLQLIRSLILAASHLHNGTSPVEDKGAAVFCLDLLIAITLNNRDRIMLIWQEVYEHISNVVQSTIMPCTLLEKAVFGLLRICQRLLPYKENLTDELLKSLQLILKLNTRVADAYCEQITQELIHLVKANATHIKSHEGWRAIISLLSITAQHPEAPRTGFDALAFIMSDGGHLLPSNYVLCVDAARQFAESRLGDVDWCVSALDMMAGSVVCLARWRSEAEIAVGQEAAMKVSQDIGEMWLRLVQGLRKVCLDHREEVRNHAILMLQRCMAGADVMCIPIALWFQCFDLVILTLLDDLLDISLQSSPKNYRKMEETLVLAMKLMLRAFLKQLQDLSQQPSFCRLILNHMERYMKVKFRGKHSEKIHELVPELLKNILLLIKTTGVLMPSDDIGGDSFWRLTWLHV
ncbi:hypothetical protein P3X46_029727 [Hevea brasiliensis]|uniref:SEC7 domain-containing protein n=1 Tax=Hevea brasiliensis TaxID=3981 RepID=A0ABQ9KT49_HEVBR|nr:hypothetical protein P3X46_029727 [Hevea brasiliensis]